MPSSPTAPVLGPLPPEGKVERLTLSLPPKLSQELDAYVRYHREHHGDLATKQKLGVAILDHFLTADSGFKAWVRQQPSAG